MKRTLPVDTNMRHKSEPKMEIVTHKISKPLVCGIEIWADILILPAWGKCPEPRNSHKNWSRNDLPFRDSRSNHRTSS